ncbi:protein FAM234A isoform X2 [Rhineura floridana]|uniref:protein FAM234A isoform X2 n=1 Tax=Rhineura floridana TaxID=261503 RepID=UPI002AC81799|nr:protein FAM234A isoform X2 [Rhineura floridana]
MEDKDLEAEIHPLKNEESKASEGQANSAKKESAPKQPGRLSRWRTAAFFLSLFLCLAVVFAFSFVIPCPVRPVSQRTWSRTYANATTYTFLAVGDVNQDRVQDVLFAFQASNGSSSGVNGSCSSEGFASPCAFLTAQSGTNGYTLWQRPVAEDLLLMDCSTEHDQAPACLVIGKPDLFAAIDLETGQTLWQEAGNFEPNSTVLSPLLKIPDVTGDGVSDLLVFSEVGEEIQSHFYSGKHGTQMGSNRSLHIPGRIGHLMQVTETGAHYVLFYTEKAVYGYSLNELYHMAFNSPADRSFGLKEDPRWAIAIDRTTHKVSLLSSGEIHYLTKMPVKSGADFLVSRLSTLELVDGQRLGSVWVTDIPHILSEPVLGSYGTNEVDIVIESRVSPKKKKVMIVEGPSGDIEWEAEVLLSGVGSPRPATLATADHRSVFLFWGTYQGDTNGTEPWEGAQQQHLYMFHPSFPNVLLEMSNSTEPVVAFEGPQAGSAPGQVVLSKRKLKEDIVGSRVIWLSQLAQDTEQSVRDRFLRMRYRSLR